MIYKVFCTFSNKKLANYAAKRARTSNIFCQITLLISRQNPHENRRSPRATQAAPEFGHARAGGHHIVDQQHFFSDGAA